MLHEANLVTEFATELVDEVVGDSSRKWAIAALVLLVGAGIALWFVKRRAGGEEIASEVTPVPSMPSGAAAASSPACSARRGELFEEERLRERLRPGHGGLDATVASASSSESPRRMSSAAATVPALPTPAPQWTITPSSSSRRRAISANSGCTSSSAGACMSCRGNQNRAVSRRVKQPLDVLG